MKVLITGFDPFGGEDINPSWEAVKALPDMIGGCEIYKQLLPTSYARGPRALADKLSSDKFDAVICVGQAGGRSRLSFERVAINFTGARIADNDGVVLSSGSVTPGGPDGLFSTLNVDAMRDGCLSAGVPADVSLSAGSFICNAVLYTALYNNLFNDGPPACFIHIPFIAQQVVGKNAPYMALEDTVKGISAAISTLGGKADGE